MIPHTYPEHPNDPSSLTQPLWVTIDVEFDKEKTREYGREISQVGGFSPYDRIPLSRTLVEGLSRFFFPFFFLDLLGIEDQVADDRIEPFWLEIRRELI
jgi:hypothetical protein